MQVKPKSWTVDIVVGPVTGKSHARQHTPGSKHAPAAKREPVYDREKSPYEIYMQALGVIYY